MPQAGRRAGSAPDVLHDSGHRAGRSCHQCRRGAYRDVAVAIAAAPAQDVSRMFTTPPVNYFRRHLKLMAVFAALSDERAEVVDKLCGGVVPDVRRAGERFVINSAT